jgi:hypothetical protein
MADADRQPVTRSLANQYEEKRQRAKRNPSRLRSAEKLACLDALRGRCHLLTPSRAQADLAALGFDRHTHTVKNYAQELGEAFMEEEEKAPKDRDTEEREAVLRGHRISQLWRRRL